MVDMIEASVEGDTFNFRMDFLMCFLIVMIDCHKQGCLRPWILHHITCELDFARINWCQLVLEKLKNCKNGWKSNDPNRSFTGALTILIVTALRGQRQVPRDGSGLQYLSMTFWTKEKLKQREKVEISSGGFGSGKLKSFTVCKDKIDDEPTVQVCKDNI
ncbi:hypothetical protein Hanom_Chr12g01157231 [Helianthus anomalus]